MNISINKAQMETTSVFYPGLVLGEEQRALRDHKEAWTVAKGIWAATNGALQVGRVVMRDNAILKRISMVSAMGNICAELAVGDAVMSLWGCTIDGLDGYNSSLKIGESRKGNYLVKRYRERLKSMPNCDVYMATTQHVMSQLTETTYDSLKDNLLGAFTRRRFENNAPTKSDLFTSMNHDVCMALIRMYTGEIANRSVLPQDLLAKLDELAERVKKAVNVMDNYVVDLDSMFSKNKWLIGVYKHGIMVGEVDSTVVLPPLRDHITNQKYTGEYSGAPIFKGTPRMYASIDAIPDDIRASVVSGIMMAKMTRNQHLWTTVEKTSTDSVVPPDPENLIGRTPVKNRDCSLQAGWVAWNGGGNSAQWLIVDKD